MLKEQMNAFIVNTPNCTPRLVIQEFPHISDTYVYRHIRDLKKKGKVRQNSAKVLVPSQELIDLANNTVIPEKRNDEVWVELEPQSERLYLPEVMPLLNLLLHEPEKVKAVAFKFLEQFDPELAQFVAVNFIHMYTILTTDDYTEIQKAYSHCNLAKPKDEHLESID